MKRALLALTLAAVFAPMALAQDDPDPFLLERLLPDSTLLYLNIPNSDTVSTDYKKSHLYKLIHNEEVKAFLDVPLAYIEKQKKEAGREASWNEQAKEATGLTVDEILDLAQGPIGFAILDLPFNEEHKLDLVFSLGNPDAKKLREAARKVKEAVNKHSRAPFESESTFKGVTISAFGTREMTVYTAMLGRTIVCATTEARMQSLIAAHVDKNQPTLDRADLYKKTKAAVSRENRHLFMLYANVPAILKTFRKEIGDETARTLEKLGITDLTSLAASLSYDGPRLHERYCLGTSATTRGIPRLLAGKTSPDPALKYVPIGSVLYSHFCWNLAEAYESILTMIEIDPKTQEEASKAIREFEQRLGVRIKEDLLATLGEDWTLFSAAPESAATGLFGTVATVTLRDSAKFEVSLSKVLADFKQKLETMTFRGQEIKYLSVLVENRGPDFDPLAHGPIPSIPIAYFIRDGRLFAATSPLALKRALLRLQESGAKDISSDEKFNSISSGSRERADAFMYLDTGRLFTFVYNTAEPILQFAREYLRDRSGEMIVDVAKLPLGETLGDLIGPSYTSKRTDSDMIVVDSLSSVGLTATSYTIVVGGAVATLALALQSGHGGGTAENERVAELTLQFIRQAEETFKNSDSDGNGIGDYWTRDVAGLYALKGSSGQIILLLDGQTAKADPEGCNNYEATKGAGQPMKGYYFKMLLTDQNGDKYQIDEAKTGNAWTNRKHFGVTAYPAQYGVTGRAIFITNEEGKTYKKDTGGKLIDAWPGKDPTKEGWKLVN